MKLKNFHIKNIKSIKDSGVCHLSDNITILAGQNESGKSAVLEALKYFSRGMDNNFEKYSIRLNGDVPYVECCFSLCDENDCNYKDENISIVLKELKEIQCYREGKSEIKFSSNTIDKLYEIILKLIEKNKVVNIVDVDIDSSLDDDPKKVIIENFIKELEETVLKYLPKFDYYSSFENILPDKISISEIEKMKQ